MIPIFDRHGHIIKQEPLNRPRLVKPDLITVWPKNNDYPLWRKQIEVMQGVFNKIIIVFMETNQGHDYRDFVRSQMPFATFVEQHKLVPGEDWRDACVKDALAVSTSEWIWFTEEDFFVGPGFWESVNRFLQMGSEVFGVFDQTRLHPCCIFIARKLLEKTSKNFGIKSGEYDHFGQIQLDLAAMKIPVGEIFHNTCYHMAGLSSNWTLAASGDTPNYKIELFRDYINQCFTCGSNLDPEWVKVAKPYHSPTPADATKNSDFEPKK